MRSASTSARWVLPAILLLGAVPAGATCPESLCDCLGSAKNFGIVGRTQLKVKYGQIKVSGYPERFPFEVAVDTCSATLQVTGSNEEAGVMDNVTALMPGPKGPKFRTKKFYGYYDPIGTEVFGDIASTGGPLDGPQYVQVDGAVDTTGTHPSVAPCTQAIPDMVSAAATLAALTPTQILPDLTVKLGEEDVGVITTGPGVNVIRIPKLQVKPLSVYGYPEGSTLEIQADSAATAIIIVVDKLVVGNQCEVVVSDPSKIDKTIIVMNGIGARVALGNEAVIEPTILAPLRAATIGGDTQGSNLYADKITVKGSTIEDSLACPP